MALVIVYGVEKLTRKGSECTRSTKDTGMACSSIKAVLGFIRFYKLYSFL